MMSLENMFLRDMCEVECLMCLLYACRRAVYTKPYRKAFMPRIYERTAGSLQHMLNCTPKNSDFAAAAALQLSSTSDARRTANVFRGRAS